MPPRPFVHGGCSRSWAGSNELPGCPRRAVGHGTFVGHGPRPLDRCPGHSRGIETGAAIAVDAAGSAYVTGFTQSPTFPTTPGAFDRTGSASNDLDAFVSKLNPAGTALVYSTFLGGTNFEWGRDLAIDAAGNAYVAGQTKSSNFPTTNGAFDRTYGGDPFLFDGDAWVAKLAVGPGTPLSPSPPASPTPVPSPSASPSPPAGQPLPAPSLLGPGDDARFAPGTTVIFDWSDVTGAASYTIQIDNDDEFPSPFTVEATATASQYTASGLPTQRRWWRVRANTGNGAAGTWSQVRRFELRN